MIFQRMTNRSERAPRLAGCWVATLLVALLAVSGCAQGPHILPTDQRKPIDRKLVDIPSGYELERYAVDLNGPVGITFDGDGNLIVAEGGLDGSEPQIHGFTPDHKRFDIYPFNRSILPFASKQFRLYGPIGGIVFHKGSLYVSHRDADDFGVITALDFKGGARTVVAGLPAQGEQGATGLAIDPRSGRLFFGIGNATNSGVVGLDDFAMGWPKRHPGVHDVPYTPDANEYWLWGRRMDSVNPAALWLMPDLAVTGPFQPFGLSNKTRIKGATRDNPKCNSAILSIEVDGGELRVEAHGIRLPKGLAFTDIGTLYFTNQGMELRGTRPVKDDPDVLLRFLRGGWYGGPDYSTDLRPITDPRFQPPIDMIIRTGYPDLSFLINHGQSELRPVKAEDAVFGVLPSQSGAAGVAFTPNTGPFHEFGTSAIVALSGDRAPYSTSGQKLTGPVGFKLVRIDVDRGQVREFLRNVQGGPSSALGGNPDQLERPVDVKFGPDGAMYILDMGQMTVKDGLADLKHASGRIYRLIPSRPAKNP